MTGHFCLMWVLGISAFADVKANAAITPTNEGIARVLGMWNKPDAPGMTWVVVSNGAVIQQGAFGLANLENHIPITTATRFNIGSMSKQFTALAVLKLERQRRLSLDDDIRRFVPELPDYGVNLTLRHLLHHTSGLQEWDQLIHLAGWRLDDVFTHQNVLSIIKSRKELNFKPGEQFSYSNSGYSLLATLVERVTGVPFADWMKTNVFAPLGLEGAVVHDNPGMLIERRAESYLPAGGGRFRRLTDNGTMLGSSSIYCSPEEFAKYLQAFDDPRRTNELARLTETSPLNNGQKNNYAGGVELGSYKGLTTISHGGIWAGFRAFMVRFPEKHLSIALFSNHGSVDPERIVFQLADAVLQKALDSVKETRQEIDLDTAALDACVGQYQLAPGLIITITREDNHLMSQATGYPKEPLFAESPTKFFFKVEDSTISFVPNGSGVSHLILNRQGQIMQATRMEFSPPSTKDLLDFVGSYFNDDLETSYTMQVKHTRLLISHARHGDIELTPAGVGTFTADQWWLGQVTFSRDERKVVTGFQVTGGRIRPVLFRKKIT